MALDARRHLIPPRFGNRLVVGQRRIATSFGAAQQRHHRRASLWTRIFVKQIVFSLLAASLVVSNGLAQTQSSSEGLSRGMSSHGSGGGLSNGSGARGGLNEGLTSSESNSGWGSGSNEGSSVSAGQSNMELQLPSSILQTAAPQGSHQDPLSYCYYNNHSYTDGARLNGQVCVHPGNGRSSDGSITLSSSPTPMRWIPAAQYARGKY